MSARTYPPRPQPGQIRGLAQPRYKVSTIDEVDAGLLSVSGWLNAMITRAPEFGEAYLTRYRYDVDLLLDQRLVLMARSGTEYTS